METIKFYSKLANKEIEAEVIEKRKKTYKLIIPANEVIRQVERKQKFVREKKDNVLIYGIKIFTENVKRRMPEKIIVKQINQLIIIDKT